jgi:hypothetical protein
MRDLIALTLRETLDRTKPGRHLRTIQLRTLRKEAAYADHHIRRKLLPPLRLERRT